MTGFSLTLVLSSFFESLLYIELVKLSFLLKLSVQVFKLRGCSTATMSG